MTQNTFTMLISNFINETDPETVSADAFASALQTASRQSLMAVMAYLNKLHPMTDDSSLNQYLNNVLRKTVYSQTIRASLFEDLSKKLSEHGISHMPVKGWYLRNLYPEPDLRSYGDIDILIHEEDREASHALMLELGYEVHDNWEPTYSYSKGSEYYEIHTNLMDGNLDGREDLMAYFREAWQHAHVHHGLCYEPDLEFHFLYTCVHLAKHLYGGGAGMRMYMDAALYIKTYGEQMDWEYINREFERLQLTDFYHMILTAVESWFEIDLHDLGFDFVRTDSKTVSDLETYTLDADLFGKLRDHAVIMARNANAAEGKNRFRLILRRIFPLAEVVGKRYTFVARHRWLLPAGWIARLITNAGSIRNESQRLKDVAALDQDSVTEYDVFMKKLGL